MGHRSLVLIRRARCCRWTLIRNTDLQRCRPRIPMLRVRLLSHAEKLPVPPKNSHPRIPRFLSPAAQPKLRPARAPEMFPSAPPDGPKSPARSLSRYSTPVSSACASSGTAAALSTRSRPGSSISTAEGSPPLLRMLGRSDGAWLLEEGARCQATPRMGMRARRRQ